MERDILSACWGGPQTPGLAKKRRPNAMPEAWRLCGQQAADK